MSTTTPRHLRNPVGFRTLVLLLLLGLLASPASLSAQTTSTSDLLKQGAELEKRHDWLGACRVYDEILRKDRGPDKVRQAFQRCLRRYHIVYRHRDPVYREALARVPGLDALDMYEHVLHTVERSYVDRRKANITALFRKGLEELLLAIEEPVFVREYLPDIPGKTLEAFKAKLNDWRERKIASRSDAREQAFAVGRTAQNLGLGPRDVLITVVTMEFISGACNALDEYTFFLTPGHYSEIQAALRGRLVSIGVDLALVDGRLEITRVYPRSPAAEAGLAIHDRILRINGQAAESYSSVEDAANQLRGKSGTSVELTIGVGEMVQTLTMRRRPVIVPSVQHELHRVMSDSMDGMTSSVPVGVLRISCFQESTLQEVKEALASLQTDGMKVLILDLRGNPGGLFKVAVQVTELFLPEGVIVLTQSQFREYNRPFKVESMNPLLVPMVVVIDGDTASAAEVVAGALKDNGRATLIGQTTFGKGSIQCIIPLEKPPFDKMKSGIRITVAKFVSPSRQPYSGQGIRPNIDFDTEGDGVLAEAKRLLLDMLKPMPPMTMPR